MKKQDRQTIVVETVAQQHQLIGLGKPKHPLVSLFRFDEVSSVLLDRSVKLISQLYQITLKRDCPCKVQYGQTPYDFDEGLMSFFAPNQVQRIEPGAWQPQSGWCLLMHPDFIRGYPLQQKLKQYGYFGYELNEALILSEDEETMIETILGQLAQETMRPIDQFSQEITLANIDLLLAYCQRYYTRQFIVRKPVNTSLRQKVETLLSSYFDPAGPNTGLPTPHSLAAQLNVSPKYLSDCLKSQTGQTTQQLIHDKLIEQAKDRLATTELSVAQIAYELGFEFSQSFSHLFKRKTHQTPGEYRQSFK